MNLFTTAPMPLTQHELLSADECENIQQRVISLRDHWIKRSGDGFYSLGTASYLDAPGRRHEYLESARHSNSLLTAGFSDVYSVITSFFEDFLFAPVMVTDELAVPGFHIFEFEQPGPKDDAASTRAHFDLQWMEAFPGFLPAATVSFTVAIEQPPSGAAMEVWPLRYGDLASLSVPVTEWAAGQPSRRLPYTNGGITIHDGNILHAIGGRRRAEPPGRRVTLQGHGAEIDGTWVLYW
jgi:hypothetical protein